MGTYRVTLLAAIFLYSYEAEFMQTLIIKDKKIRKLKPLISLSEGVVVVIVW